jgi:hypothetical protein
VLRSEQRGRFHAQLTGILAGLAFTSIVLILQSSTLSGRGAEAGLLSFFSALSTLLIAASSMARQPVRN